MQCTLKRREPCPGAMVRSIWVTFSHSNVLFPQDQYTCGTHSGIFNHNSSQPLPADRILSQENFIVDVGTKPSTLLREHVVNCESLERI